jgi:hypothetical protein
MPLKLDTHDQALVAILQAAMKDAISKAHMPAGVAKRISVLATALRNRGRNAARKGYPFKGTCEASGLPLDKKHAELDEMEPELGYEGKLRWVCSRANNSGTHSCGACK